MKPLFASLVLLATVSALAQTAPPAPPAPAAPPALGATPALPAPPAPPALPAEPGRLYAPGAFDRIDLAGAARVVLVQGERDQVFVAGDDSVQKSLRVELNDRQLTIRPAGGWHFWSGPRLSMQIEVRQLKALSLSGASDLHAPGPVRAEQLKLSISGAGSARFDKLQAQQLVFSISGAGDGMLAGQVEELALHISGKGKVIADQLRTQRARVSVSGIGNATLWVIDDLSANISGVGSIDYFGQPQVQRSVSGIGHVNSKGDKR
jgi:hypothetical protein